MKREDVKIVYTKYMGTLIGEYAEKLEGVIILKSPEQVQLTPQGAISIPFMELTESDEAVFYQADLSIEGVHTPKKDILDNYMKRHSTIIQPDSTLKVIK